jgi:diguanylate cyclase (GGDEF)-like protein
MSLIEASAGWSWKRDLEADGQSFLTVVARPMPGGPIVAHHARAWAVLAFGLIITAAVVAYIRSSRWYAARMIRANQQVFDLAQTDALTGLANRRVFVERLDETFAACRRGGTPFAVLYLDLDHFKDINDTLGHPIGDALLRDVGARIRNATRADDVVARFGGDEFAILQRDADDSTMASALAGKIREVIGEPYLIEDNKVHVTASIGISRYTADDAGSDAMMIQSDLALYQAKQEWRNCVRFYNAALEREVQERVTIAEQLREAPGRNELELYYQPQVNLRTGEIIGMEALLRWNSPAHGQIPPAVFVAVAERCGQISALGQWALDAACRQFRAWQEETIAPGVLGVNISALHIKGSPALDSDFANSLETWAVAPRNIEIELTESVLMEITQQHNDRFERLRRLGVRIAIDDFGTGYSSLSYLANYPVHRVKIAQQLVFGVASESRSATIVRAAIRMAHELGIDVIAEGVENEAQAQFLLSAGCAYAQGYYFSKPVDAQCATELLRSGKIRSVRPVRPVRIAAA